MEPLTTHQIRHVVRNLIGEVHPVGDTAIDDRRIVNLNKQIVVIELLLSDIIDVALHADHHLASVREAGQRAVEFLSQLRETDQ